MARTMGGQSDQIGLFQARIDQELLDDLGMGIAYKLVDIRSADPSREILAFAQGEPSPPATIWDRLCRFPCQILLAVPGPRQQCLAVEEGFPLRVTSELDQAGGCDGTSDPADHRYEGWGE